jgi:hypothetical protein
MQGAVGNSKEPARKRNRKWMKVYSFKGHQEGARTLVASKPDATSFCEELPYLLTYTPPLIPNSSKTRV